MTGPKNPKSLSDRGLQVVLARFQDHTELLRALTTVDLQVLGGFMALQFGLAAWLVDHTPKTIVVQGGLLFLSTILTALAIKLLYNGHRRRDEVVASLSNTKTVLRLGKKGVYLKDQSLDAEMTYRPWWPWYVIACILTLIAVSSIILFGGFERAA